MLTFSEMIERAADIDVEVGEFVTIADPDSVGDLHTLLVLLGTSGALLQGAAILAARGGADATALNTAVEHIEEARTALNERRIALLMAQEIERAARSTKH
jgi:hypothetical protein